MGKGLWIDRKVKIDKSLTWKERMFLAEIISFHKKNGCYASNKYFAKEYGLGEGNIAKIFSSLEKKGKITRQNIWEKGKIIKRLAAPVYCQNDTTGGTVKMGQRVLSKRHPYIQEVYTNK